MTQHWDQLVCTRENFRWAAGNADSKPQLRPYDINKRSVKVKTNIVKKRDAAFTGRGSVWQGGLLARQRTSEMSGEEESGRTSARSSTGECRNSDPTPVTGENGANSEVPARRRSSVTSALELFVGREASDVTWDADLAILGKLTSDEKQVLDWDAAGLRAPDRLICVFGWIVEDINSLQPCIRTPPPILSRSYQELSQGMTAFNQALKMSDVPFPFPFSQLLDVLLVVFTGLIPLLAGYVDDNLYPSCVQPFVGFFITMAFLGLMSISRTLENPFADGPNQLPCIDLHERLIETIRDGYHKRRVHDPAQRLRQGFEEKNFMDVRDSLREAAAARRTQLAI